MKNPIEPAANWGWLRYSTGIKNADGLIGDQEQVLDLSDDQFLFTTDSDLLKFIHYLII